MSKQDTQTRATSQEKAQEKRVFIPRHHAEKELRKIEVVWSGWIIEDNAYVAVADVEGIRTRLSFANKRMFESWMDNNSIDRQIERMEKTKEKAYGRIIEK